MTEEQKKKRVLPIVGLVLVAILVVSLASYAYWQITEKQTGRNVVGTACLDISFSGSNDIKLENAWPITDEEGSETTPYTFTIENHCDDPINYQVALESLYAQEGESTNYLGYEYLRVKLNDNESNLYSNLTDITPESGTRDTKELAHHTLAANGSVTYNLRLWIDENTPLQNADETLNTSKYFYGKIRVVAGQNVEGDPVPTLKLLTDPNEPDVTLSNIQVGDLVGYQIEQFYVIGIDGNNVKLLSRYLINVGDYQNQNVTSGLQSAELGYTRPSLNSGPVEYHEKSEESYYYGSVPFSSSNYWWDNNNWTWVSPYTANSFVYNENASISNYVNGYVQALQTMGLSVTNGALLSLEELSTLCNTNITTSGDYSSQCPSYLLETTYWLGSVNDHHRVWYVDARGYLWSFDYDDDGGVGVRPVITISLS